MSFSAHFLANFSAGSSSLEKLVTWPSNNSSMLLFDMPHSSAWFECTSSQYLHSFTPVTTSIKRSWNDREMFFPLSSEKDSFKFLSIKEVVLNISLNHSFVVGVFMFSQFYSLFYLFGFSENFSLFSKTIN